MNRFLVLVTVLLNVGIQANVFGAEGRSHYGLQGGLTFSNTDNSTPITTNSLTGFTGGVLLETPFVPGLVYFQPELNFIQKGSSVAVGGVTITNRLSYIELPVNLKVKLDLGGLRPFVMAGPKLGYLIGATQNSDNYNKFDFGLNFGAGAGFAITASTELVLTGRYGLGLTNINGAAGGPTAQNHTFEIGAGVLF
jgi:opacity protein-like surface antigen